MHLKLLRHKTDFPGFTSPFLKPTYSHMPQLSPQYSPPHYGNSLNWHYSTIQHSRPQLFALPRSILTSRRVHPTQPSRKVANNSSFVHEILGLSDTLRLPVATLSTTPSDPQRLSHPSCIHSYTATLHHQRGTVRSRQLMRTHDKPGQHNVEVPTARTCPSPNSPSRVHH